MDESLIKLLEQTGFTKKEAQVYLALLSVGQGNVSDIAKISELKRPIIYIILEGLIKRGYVSQLPNKKINIYQALDPSIILKQLKTTTKNFSQMLPIFMTLANKGNKRPKIQYIETKEGIWKIYEEMNYLEDVFLITSYARIEKYFPNSVDDWVKKCKKGIYKIKAKHLLPANADERKITEEFKNANQEVRFLKKLENINMDFALYGNKLAITSFEENSFMVVIESIELSNSMRLIFEIIWKQGREF